MLCDGLAVMGARHWLVLRAGAVVLAALSVLSAGCGDGEGKKRAIECQTDADCDTSALGVCDTVSCDGNRCTLGTLPDGHRCSDDDPLTGNDACLDGICAGVVKT